jgi:hypothetical protein
MERFVNWFVSWHGYLDVSDKFRKFLGLPSQILDFLILFEVVTRFGNEERSVGIGDIGEFTGLEEFVLDEVNIVDV